jgi:SAM-dependent methyltransferase
MGTGTGFLAAFVARSHADVPVLAVDADPAMLALAAKRHGSLPNLDFRLGNATHLAAVNATSVVLSSVLHEVYSAVPDEGREAVAAALGAARKSLKPGGSLVIRDFVFPEEGESRVVLRHDKRDIVPGHDFATFSERFFGRVLRDEVSSTDEAVEYTTDLESACEFVLRKDFHEMWEMELLERYGFWTRRRAERALLEAGFHLEHFELLDDAWIVASSLAGKATLRDAATGEYMPFPSCKALVVARRR